MVPHRRRVYPRGANDQRVVPVLFLPAANR
jgi:hypothetical protein